MADKRAFTIEINGLEKSYKDAETLLNALSKLPPLISDINKQSANVNKVANEANKQSRERKATLTDEEKAERKLAETIDRVVTARTQANRAQVDANMAARNAQREVQLEQNLINASANSISEMRAKLALLNNEWKNTDIDSERFAELREEIRALNDELKEQESLIGDNRRNVGNYQEATLGLQDQLNSLSESVNSAAESSKNMLNLFQAGVTTFAMFGDQSESTQEILTKVSKVMAALSLVQQLNNGILSKSIILEKAKIVTDALVTRGIITQTTAQKALNVATTAFPLVAIIALLGTFIALTSSSTEKTKSFTSAMDGVSFASKEARDKHDDFVRSIRDLQIQIDVTTGKLTQYEADILQIQNSFKDKTDEIKKNLKDSKDSINDEISSLEKINKVADKISQVAPIFYPTKFAANYFIADKIEKENKEIANLTEDSNSQIINAEVQKNLQLEALAAKRVEAARKMNEQNSIETKDGLDKTLALIKYNREEELKTAENNGADVSKVNAKYDKQEREARASSAKTAGDEAKARRIKELEERKAILQKELELVRKSEDDQTSLIKDEFERREKQVTTQYNRQREDLQNQLDTDKNLTEESREAINNIILNIDQHLTDDLLDIEKDRNEKLLSNQKSYLDMMLDDYQIAYSKIADLPKTINQKNGMIDVEASQRNYDKINSQLTDYVNNLTKSKKDVTKYYDDLMATYETDSLEYAQAAHDKKNALRSIDTEVKSVNQEIADNNKESLDLQAQYWEEYCQKVTEFLGNLSSISSSIFDSMDSMMQMSIDSAKEKLEELTTAYDKAVADREESDSRLEALSERAKSAEGSRSAALISQLNQEMEKNKALADQEKSLAKQKEKLEADIAKKEKKQKKMAAGQQVLQAGINTALGITAALSSANIPLSVIIGALGAVQTAVAAANYAKMEKGGYIDGKRHAQGGEIREVEGGEYVINREATRQNRALLDVINTTNTVPYSFMQGDNTVDVREVITNNTSMQPSILPDTDMNKKLDILNETLQNKDFNPVISVVDINKVQNQVAVMDHLTNT